jgi:hypothetical protein
MNIDTETFINLWVLTDPTEAFNMQADPLRQFKCGVFVVKYRVKDNQCI